MTSSSTMKHHSAAPGRGHGLRPRSRELGLPVAAGTLGALFLAGLYLGIVALAQGWNHAIVLFWQDKALVAPIVAGFGIQVGLYTFIRVGLHAAARGMWTLTGAGVGTSTVAMVACCAHHVADVLPILGLTAAATFLAAYQVAFMLVGLGTTLLGIGLMLVIIAREQRRTIQVATLAEEVI
jgi:hypothetical protein